MYLVFYEVHLLLLMHHIITVLLQPLLNKPEIAIPRIPCIVAVLEFFSIIHKLYDSTVSDLCINVAFICNLCCHAHVK